MNRPTLTKLNESFSYIDADSDTLIRINDFLKVKDESLAMDTLVQRGLKSPFKFFASIQNGKLLIYNGHIDLVKNAFNLRVQGFEDDVQYPENEIDKFLTEMKEVLPFEPYDFQIKAFKESLLKKKQINIMSTSSGKSLTISLLIEFLRRKGKRGLLLVPNINLLTQFHDDIKSYNLPELYDDVRIIGGGNTERKFDKSLVISTWQSLQDYQELVKDVDFLICDELQYYASDVTSEIVMNTFNCTLKLGFTGTLPEDKCKKMTLLGLFSSVQTFITPRQLIDRGLATPIEIKTVKLFYEHDEVNYVKSMGTYLTKLKFIKEHELRQRYCVELLSKVKNLGNTLGLFSHTEHGKSLFIDLMKLLYPDVEVTNKDIVGKKSFDFQCKYGIFFLNGEDNAETREKTRKILEEFEDAVLIANYALLSTGVSIKRLHNCVLCSPLKTYTTITQTIGRGMRLFEGKKVFRVFDIVDQMSTFKSQYRHRNKTSYQREQHPVDEIEITLRSYFSYSDW